MIVDGWIADITGDQFSNRSIYLNYDIPDYYGPGDDFRRLFEVEGRDEYPLGDVLNMQELINTTEEVGSNEQ